MKQLLIILYLLVFVGCSSFSKRNKEFSSLSEPTDSDYIDFMASTGEIYLKSEDIQELKINTESTQYLEQIYERIVSNNEVLMSRSFKPRFHVVKNKTPFIFSLPKAQFFISSGLVERYLKSEEIFVSALASEILKSNRNIYEKRMMLPLGFYSSEKMILMTRLRPEIKFKINEWTYFVLKRAGYDSSVYLNWIQVQNRNTLDFSLFLGDAVGISKEEHLFKNFMAKQGVIGVEKKIVEANSSKPFYKLLNNVVGNK